MVRSGKVDDIRRLVVNAMSMCDSERLAYAKKALGSVVRSLDALREEKKIKKRSVAGSDGRILNPRTAIAQVESMIKKEKEKTIFPEGDGLING